MSHVLYRRNVRYDMREQNESRADLAEWALVVATDCNGQDAAQDVFLDVSDLIANLMHFCQRAGLDWDDVQEHGLNGFQGDAADGPPVQRDKQRFPFPTRV